MGLNYVTSFMNSPLGTNLQFLGGFKNVKYNFNESSFRNISNNVNGNPSWLVIRRGRKTKFLLINLLLIFGTK